MSKLDRVLFLGNSMTLHMPKAEIGWYGSWGMAASSKEKDYVHVLINRIQGFNPDSSFIVRNVYEFEKQYWEYDFEALKECRDFEASLIVMFIGDNCDDSEVESRNFGYYYERLIDYVNSAGTDFVICINCFFEKPSINRIIKTMAAHHQYTYIDISHLFRCEGNTARNQFWHAGVGSHPSDLGMSEIAKSILLRIENSIDLTK